MELVREDEDNLLPPSSRSSRVSQDPLDQRLLKRLAPRNDRTSPLDSPGIVARRLCARHSSRRRSSAVAYQKSLSKEVLILHYSS